MSEGGVKARITVRVRVRVSIRVMVRITVKVWVRVRGDSPSLRTMMWTYPRMGFLLRSWCNSTGRTHPCE